MCKNDYICYIIFIIIICNAFIIFDSYFDLRNHQNVIYIYNDEGVAEESLLQTKNAIKDLLHFRYSVKTINAKEVQKNRWVKDAVLFIMPGGADLPYVSKLQGSGNINIKNYVEKGGSFLGICAGSYYGSGYVEFDKNGKFEVLGSRELSFFQGKAIGPILAEYDYSTNIGARVAYLKVDLDGVNKLSAYTYYNGGGYFEDADNYDNVWVIARYENNLPAIIHVSYGLGNVVLSAVHFEYNPHLLDTSDIHIKNIIAELKRYDVSRKALFAKVIKDFLLKDNKINKMNSCKKSMTI